MQQSGDMTSAFESALASAETSAVADTSPVSTPTPDSSTSVAAPAADAAAAPTTQPEAQSSEAGPVSAEAEKPKGEPPAWRWQDILENTRKSVADETAARVTQEYESRVATYENERRGYEVLTAALQGDAQALAMVAQADPSLAARLRGQAQETPSGPEPEPQPDAAIQLPDGRQVPVFTPEGMKAWQQWNQKTTLAAMKQEFQPLMATTERLKAAEQAAEQQAQTQRWAASVLAPVQRLPHFAEFKPQILKAIQELPATHAGPLEEVVYDAYSRLFAAKLEQIPKDAEAKALASLQQRAVAGTTNPGAPTATTPGRFKTGEAGFAAALAHFAGAR